MELELKGRQSSSAVRLIRTVIWSFLGVRNSQSHAEDTVDLSLKQVAVAGVIGGVLFVLTLLTLVNFIV